MATLESILAEILTLRTEVKNLTKLTRKVRSVQDDPNGEKASARSKTNGFNRPVMVDEELRAFLGLPDGEKIARSEVTKRINAYVKENGLKHPENGRVIVMDEKLKALLNPPEDIQVTFLNLQRYIGPHYVKEASEEAPPAEAPPAEAPPVEAPKVKKVVRRPVVRKPVTEA